MSEEETIVSLSEAWMRAIASNRAPDIEPYMADEWLLVTPEAGPVEKRQFLEAIGSGDLVHDDMRTSGEPRVRIYGNSAVLISRVRNHGRYQGQPFEYDEWSTDTYVRSGDGWRCVLTALTPVAVPAGQ